jgi:glycosyltransferase involved in cell wall biosynthesis
MDPVETYDLRALARQAGIDPRRVIFSDRELTSGGLNELYNACDVGVNTSAGEGWGLVSFEHAATGAAQVVPRHSACAELWAGAGVFLEPAGSSRAPMALCENQDVTAAGLSAALTRLYDDEACRREMNERAYRTALDPRYRWDTIARGWNDLFSSLVGVSVGA